MKKSRTAIVLAVSCLFWVIILSSISNAQESGKELTQIVDDLVASFNKQNAAAYRNQLSEKLRAEFTLENIRDVLSAKAISQGQILSYNTITSPDGKRGLVFLETESGKYDVHIRINDNRKIERTNWYPHKTEPSANSLSGHEKHQIRKRYQPYADKFIQALRDTQPEVILSLLAPDDDDDWTVEDYRSFLIEMNDRGIKEIGELEVIAANEVIIPIYFESVDMGFSLGFDKEDKISSLRISDYVVNESRGLSYLSLGADTIKTVVLNNFDELREAFSRDSGKVRLITLLSPT